MVTVTYLSVILATVTQSAAAKLYHRREGSAAVFNLIKAVTAALLLALMTLGGFTLHLPTVLFGLAYGACLAASMYAGYRALCLGPMALTSMLVSFSVAIPLLFGLTVGDETLKPPQLVGLLLLAGAMILTNADKLRPHKGEEDTERRRYGLWLLLVGITFFCNGVCSILQKRHQTLYPEAYTREFMLFAMLLSALVFALLALAQRQHRAKGAARGRGFGVLAGLGMGLANFLTLALAGLENASVLFPLISAGTLLGALLCGRLLFRERLKGNQYAALALGITAAVLLKL